MHEQIRLLGEQLTRMRGMLFGYSERFFDTIRNWAFLTIGLLVLVSLDDGPERAAWLSDDQKALLAERDKKTTEQHIALSNENEELRREIDDTGALEAADKFDAQAYELVTGKRAIEALIRAGACDSFGADRAVLLASMGSHVPASACRLGPIDAIHTRIGAADDLANAQSTFMLEMTEAAQILRSATPIRHCVGRYEREIASPSRMTRISPVNVVAASACADAGSTSAPRCVSSKRAAPPALAARPAVAPLKCPASGLHVASPSVASQSSVSPGRTIAARSSQCDTSPE